VQEQSTTVTCIGCTAEDLAAPAAFSYEDDVDQGEFFLYTGSGGRDLSGNKRTNKARCSALRLHV
jgi:hypothetical protein